MNIKEEAKNFAINAHMGQVRKNEPDKPMIIHPIGVAMLLEQYGYDDNVVAAGYLHDVVEDTPYTIEDIERYFGEDIKRLVMNASEPDKSLSWEERKMHTINNTKHLPLRNKLIICADKINNLEDIMIKFQKTGERDFSRFKRGEEKQKWYYTNIYKSLIYNEDENLEIFKRLKNTIDIVYENKEDIYLKDTIYGDNKEYYDKLKKLHAEKMELQKLRSLCTLTKPYVIEFMGTPRTGKTTAINNLYDFFKKGGFNVSLIDEFTTSKRYKEELKNNFSKLNTLERNIKIAEYVSEELMEEATKRNDIIIVDRSINDRQVWNYRIYNRKDMDEDIYLQLRDKYSQISKVLIDYLVITYTDPLTSLKRDYNGSLALEERSFLNTNNISEYNKCLNDIEDVLKISTKNRIKLDTTDMSLNDISVKVASNIMPEIRNQYVKTLNKKYN